jgi:hypothetical protein
MAENLRTTHYANGTAIPLVNTVSSWDVLTATSKALLVQQKLAGQILLNTAFHTLREPINQGIQ